MANLPDLSGSNIQDTFQRVLHIGPNRIITDGTGSEILSSAELTSLQTIGSANITSTEWLEIANIGSHAISAAEWSYVAGGQPHGTGDSPTFAKLTTTDLHPEAGYATITLPSDATGDQPHFQTSREDIPTPSIFLGNATENIISFVTDGGDIVSAINQDGEYLGLVTNATTAGTVTTAAQPNITSVGTLTSITSTGNSILGNVLSNIHKITGHVTISGNISASGIIIANEANIVGNITASGNISASGILYGTDIIGDKWKVEHDDTNLIISSSGNKYLQANAVQITDSDIALNIPSQLYVVGDITTTSHITASGNISASGKIYSDNEEFIWNSFYGPTGGATSDQWYGPKSQGPTNEYWNQTFSSLTAQGKLNANSGFTIPFDCKITGMEWKVLSANGIPQSFTASLVFANFSSMVFPVVEGPDINDSVSNCGETSIAFNPDMVIYDYYRLTKTDINIDLPAYSMIFPRYKVLTTDSGKLRGQLTILYKRRKV